MKELPRVLFMGRPNVGKSTLINKIIGAKRAITEDTPGVTRDLASYPTEWSGIPFLVVDSGGVFFDKVKDIYLQEQIEKSVRQELERANKIVFLVDYKTGLHSQDKVISNFLRPYMHKVILAVNKMDNIERRYDVADFYALGYENPHAISSLHGNGIGDLLDAVIDNLPVKERKDWEEHVYKISIVGRPNVGKSSLINALVNEEKMLVDDQWGTTRDAVEIYFEHHKNKYLFIDTAGIRKQAKIQDSIEYFSVLRSNDSIRRSDLVIVIIDAANILSEQDKKVINYVQKMNRNMLIFINKWDLTERTDKARRDIMKFIKYSFPALTNYPFIFGSAKERHNIGRIFDLIPEVIATSEIRIPTSELNRFVEEVIQRNPPKGRAGKLVRVFYATQADTNPPEFIFFVNENKYVNAEYQRFIENRIREYFGGYQGVPVKISFKTRRSEKSRKDLH